MVFSRIKGNSRALCEFFFTLLFYLELSLLVWVFSNISSLFTGFSRLVYTLVVASFSVPVGVLTFNSDAGIQEGKEKTRQKICRQTIIDFF